MSTPFSSSACTVLCICVSFQSSFELCITYVFVESVFSVHDCIAIHYYHACEMESCVYVVDFINSSFSPTVPSSLTEGIGDDVLDANLQLPSERLGDLPHPHSVQEEEEEKEEEIETIIYEELSDEENGEKVSWISVVLSLQYRDQSLNHPIVHSTTHKHLCCEAISP